MTQDIILVLRDFFYNISIWSVQYLGWVTAIVAAILTLTTIIFTQYNERNINNSNELGWGIVEKLAKRNTETDEEVIRNFNKIITLLMSTGVYKSTLKLFCVTCVLIVFAWILCSVGYSMDSDTKADMIIVALSTAIILIPFVSLPFILVKFNKRKIRIVGDEKGCTLTEGLLFLSQGELATSAPLFKDFVNPKMIVSLDSNKKVEFEYSHSLMLNGYVVVFKLNCGQDVSYHRFTIKESGKSRYYKLVPTGKDRLEELDEGLFNKIKSSTRNELFVSSLDGKIKLSYLLNKNHGNQEEISLSIDRQSEHRDFPVPIIDMINYKSDKLVYKKVGKDIDYNLEMVGVRTNW